MYANVCSQIKIQWKSFTAALECALNKKPVLNLDIIRLIGGMEGMSPEMVFLPYEPIDVFLIYSTQQKLYHIRHRHALGGRVYADVCALRCCLWTFWNSLFTEKLFNWLNKRVTTFIPLWGQAIVLDSSSSDCFLGFILKNWKKTKLVSKQRFSFWSNTLRIRPIVSGPTDRRRECLRAESFLFRSRIH